MKEYALNFKEIAELGIFLAAIIAFIFKDWISMRMANPRQPMDMYAATQTNRQITDILRGLCKQFGCLRTFLCQLSNGDSWSSGQGIKYVSISHEWTMDDERGRHYHKVPIDNLSNEVLSKVNENGFRKEFSYLLMPEDLRKEISSFNARTALYLKITDGSKNKNMIGMLVLHWREDECLISDDQIRIIQNHACKELESIFMDLRAKK